jgi:3-deoxy-D-manno-octulosonic-acid transferase
MTLLYDILYLLCLPVMLVSYGLRRKFHSGFSLRFGRIPENIVFRRPVWVHAVSVGEAIAVKALVERLRAQMPDAQFVFSTVTPTGNSVIRACAREGDWVTYAPVDLSAVVAKVVARVNPSLMIIAETEIWPNLITQLYRRGVPTVVVNARISDRSFSRYRVVSRLLRPVFSRVTHWCAQSERDAARIRALGACADAVTVTGNLKFDALAHVALDEASVRQRMGILPSERVVVAGSTHSGEERMLMEAFKELLVVVPALRLIIAPRHPQRVEDVELVVREAGCKPARLSSLNPEAACGVCQPPVVIVDTVGKLMQMYAVADAVFVGGSLVEKGGHNIIEPALLGKPVVSGPHVFNFRDIADLFARADACMYAHNVQELVAILSRFLTDKVLAQAYGERARELVRSQQGAVARTIEIIARCVRASR